MVCPVYISEYAETSIRGTLGTCFQLFLTIGILFVYLLGAVTTWIQLSWLCLGIPILNLVGLFLLPESPIWLLKNVSYIFPAFFLVIHIKCSLDQTGFLFLFNS